MIYQLATSIADFLQVPKGYQLEHLLVTTYSLRGDVMLSLAAYAFLAADDPEASLEEVALKDIVLRDTELHAWAKEHITVLSNSPMRVSDVSPAVWDHCNALAEECCKTVRVKGGEFHSKLLLACFKKTDGEEWKYRLQIGSKNLGGGSAVEVALCLDGDPTAEPAPNGEVLYRFLEQYCKGKPYLVPLQHTLFHKLEADQTCDFQITNIRFAYNQDGQKDIIDVLKEEVQKELEDGSILWVYSPFLTPEQDMTFYLSEQLQAPQGAVQYHTNMTTTLVEWWNQQTQKQLSQQQDRTVWCINPTEGHFLHAKMYCWKKNAGAVDKRKYRICLGSANASKNGLEKNSEFVVFFDWEIPKQWGGEDAWAEEKPSAINRLLRGFKVQNLEYTCTFQKLSALVKQGYPLPDPEKEVVYRKLQAFLTGFCGEISPATSGQGWEITVTKPKNSVSERVSDIRIYIEEMLWQEGTPLVLKVGDLPSGNLLRGRIQAKYNDELLDIKGCFPFVFSGTCPPGTKSADPIPMCTMMRELRAIDTIPYCLKAGFTSAGEEVFERLEAYFAAGETAGQGKRAMERLINNVERVCQILKEDEQNRNAVDVVLWKDVCITKEEQDNILQLQTLLEAMQKVYGEERSQ